MNQWIKNIIKQNKKLFFIAKVLRLIHISTSSEIDGSKKKHPKVIQLPITYKCNSKCVMCNIWKMDSSNEANPAEFAQFMKDPLFKEVQAVGINGGEPSLLPNLPEYVQEILKLPKLTSLNIISNGFGQKLLLKSLRETYSMCAKKGVKLHISISLDGVGEIHDTVRRTPGAFEKTTSTIDEIIKNKHIYFDSFDIGCTVVKQNVPFLMELDSYAKSKNYNIKYRLGIENKRIESDRLIGQFSLLNSPLRQTAKEFFHYQMSTAKSLYDKFKYFSIFSWLTANQPKRLLGCAWKDESVTLDSRGELYYCAVASDSIGSLRKKPGESIYFDEKSINYRKAIITNNCDSCIHDYNGKPELNNILYFLKEIITQETAMKIYRLKAWLL
jgi:MoaA/NifB/PqqE/SkfB family radical SAM enzyme